MSSQDVKMDEILVDVDDRVLFSEEEVARMLQARLRRFAEMHGRNLECFVAEAERLLRKGDVRDAAEKAWAAFKSLLGVILARRVYRRVASEVAREARVRDVEAARKMLD